MDNEKLFEMFKEAVDKEHEAYETYKDIAENVDDDNLKKIFKDMADDELRHKEQIMEQYNILKNN
jgi:rubrerythrin